MFHANKKLLVLNKSRMAVSCIYRILWCVYTLYTSITATSHVTGSPKYKQFFNINTAYYKVQLPHIRHILYAFINHCSSHDVDDFHFSPREFALFYLGLIQQRVLASYLKDIFSSECAILLYILYTLYYCTTFYRPAHRSLNPLKIL